MVRREAGTLQTALGAPRSLASNTFSSVPGTHKRVIKTLQRCFKGQPLGEHSVVPEPGFRQLLPALEEGPMALASVLAAPWVCVWGGAAGDPQMEQGQRDRFFWGQRNLTFHESDFTGRGLPQDSESMNHPTFHAKWCVHLCFSGGRARRIPQIPQGVQQRKRGRTSEPGPGFRLGRILVGERLSV